MKTSKQFIWTALFNG